MPTLDFKGKQHIYAHHLTVPYRPLIPDADKSLNPTNESDDNLIIHGDNLHALKSLLPRYAGRIKCIYIDPPYNTGSQAWVWNDNVNSPMMQKWLQDNKPVDGEDLERHDKWLCMMWPRLQLLYELLSDDGVIFVSIDDHEHQHLRLMMDEVFGEYNFISCVSAVVNLKGSRDNRGFTNTHEYVLVYEKLAGRATLREIELEDEELSEWDQDEVGWFKQGANLKYSGENAPRERRPNLYYALYVSSDGNVGVDRNSDEDAEIWPIADNGREVTWRWGKERVAKNPDELVASRSRSGWTIRKKQRPTLGVIPTRKPKSTFYSPNHSSTTATTMLKDLFEGSRVFDYPKSVYFLADLLRIAGVGRDDIVLDSFAGSGTTAHAVLALNKEDGGNRKFILVECEDYADNITAERVRRVINGVPKARDATLREGLSPGGFTYCTLGNPIELERMLNGRALPSYEDLATYLIHTATGISAGENDLILNNEEGMFYTRNGTNYYLLYKPSIEYLRSNDAVLNEQKAERISTDIKQQGKKAVVFAPSKFIGQRYLTRMDITFCQLPYGMYQSNLD